MEYNTNELIKKVLSYKYKSSASMKIDEFIGILSLTIYNKDLFRRNEDIKKFTDYVFKKTYLDYVYSSRPNIMGRLTNDILEVYYDDKNNQDLVIYIDKLIEYFDLNLFDVNMEEINGGDKLSGKKNANKKLSKWLERL